MSASQSLIITEEKQGSELRVSLEGHLDRLTSPELDSRMSDEYLAGFTKVVFDLEKLEYLSSAGLRVFLRIDNLMDEKDGMIITHANPVIMDIFEICGFTEIMTIEP